MTLGEQIRTLREERGWTLKQLGELTGYSYQYLSDIERDRQQPSGKFLMALADRFGVQVRLVRDYGVRRG